MHDDSSDDPLTLSRRTLIRTSLPVIAGVSLGFGCGGATLPTTTVAGPAVDSLAMNTPTRLASYDVFLLRTDEGVAAISGRCTHAGCGVEPEGEGYSCPCHGSTFEADGTVTSGPADSDLTWFAVDLTGGQVTVDPDRAVAKGTFTPVG